MDCFVIATLEKDVDLTFLGFALACDYRITTKDSVLLNRFLDLNVPFGLLPWFLSQFIGPSAATEFLLCARL